MAYLIAPAIVVTMITHIRACLGLGHSRCLSLAVAGPAVAAEKKPAPANLPGVEGGYKIVKPYAPGTRSGAGRDRSADGNIKVSGQLTIDVGTGRLPLPRN